jgi:lipoprotein-anchoring transpeptidase ErfK/SrfK
VEELYQKFYMRATHMRLVPERELTPISPDVPGDEKWIEVDLMKQLLVAWEGETPVYAHRVATGLKDHGTPDGTFYIFDKRISERMVGGAASDEDSDYYNLAGVPFVCYIHKDWVAIHGTFWHNDYGQVHSHGCINVPPYASRWVWRWSAPIVEGLDLERFYVRPATYNGGTRVVVHW